MKKNTRRYFSRSRRGGGSLLIKIIGLLALVGLVFVGAGYLYARFSEDGSGGVPLWGRSLNPEEALSLVAQAEDALNKGDPAGAEQILMPLRGNTHPEYGPRVAVLLAEISLQRGTPDQAVVLLENALNQFQLHQAYPELLAHYGQVLETVGRTDRALEVYEELRQRGAGDARAIALTGLARARERAGDTWGALQLYQEAVNTASWGSKSWLAAAEPLGKLNVAAVFSPVDTPKTRWYTVERGDTLIKIGIKLNVPLGMLTRANSLPEDAVLRPGQRLRYIPKDFRIVIERSTCRLYLMDSQGLFKYYRVGLGMPGHETTLGRYTIGNKQKDPVWHKPGVGPIPAGDPANELGTRWMPLVPVEPGLPTDLGIHGTIAPDSIGKYSSHGCARMLKEDVEELYDLVVRSTPVEIVETYQPGLDGLVPLSPEPSGENGAAPSDASPADKGVGSGAV
ncbi:MAG TPA: L,D-transpeptidase family protein [Candidatus Hydrogenedentes bacterium]|nr:L,D-transpeptidase family protein [Candidatus Hydrogenedentota bacterium]